MNKTIHCFNYDINVPIKNELYFILSSLKEKGYEAYLVGGAVRNILLNKDISDYDITTSAKPSEVKEVLHFAKNIDTGIKLGTITSVYNGVHFEITTFRKDNIYIDNRHPNDVSFVSSLELDLIRRDFTINAMCYDGKFYDMFNGRSDLDQKLIRAINDPNKRFTEDALRILRALRFSASLGFTIEKNTKDAIFNTSALLNNISVERINQELFKMFEYDVKSIIDEYFPIFQVIFPFLSLNNKNYIIDKIDSLNDYRLKYALLFTNNIIEYKKYKLSNKLIHIIMIVNEDIKIDIDRVSIKKILKKYDIDDIIMYVNYHYSKNELIKNQLLELIDEVKDDAYRINHLKISGDDLLKLGLAGKDIFNFLNNICDLVIEGKISNNKEQILDYIVKSTQEK